MLPHIINLGRQYPRAIFWSLVVAGAAALLFVGTLPDSHRDCTRTQETHYNDYESPDFFEITHTFVVCEGWTLDANADLLTAVATAVMAIFTGTLWWTTASTAKLSAKTVDLAEKQFLMEGRQADLAEKQHGLMRLQHIAANKPHLAIRSIVVERSPRDGTGSMFRKGLKLTGSLVVANTGATDAIIKESRYRFYWSQSGLPMKPPLEGENFEHLQGPERDQIIRGYGSCIYKIKSDEELGGDVQGSKRGGGIYFYVMGTIRYADVTGQERMMGFCRQYVPPDSDGEGSFRPVDNPDYEYQD